jgi:hypothetical protein
LAAEPLLLARSENGGITIQICLNPKDLLEGVFWMTVTSDDVDKAVAAFDSHGRSAVLFGRLIPAIRT